MANCPAFDPTGPYVSNVLAWSDCQILSFGTTGYALLGPSSPMALAWTLLLTILVGIFGYRLIFTGHFVLRDLMIGIGKVGLVLALAGQWPAYRTLVYDLVVNGPTELAAALTGQGDAANTSNLGARIDGANAAIAELIPAPAPQAAPPGAGEPQAPQAQATGGMHDADQKYVRWSGTILTVSSLAALVTVRFVSGLLIGLGPLFIALLLFDATQGLFIGWLRVLAGACLGMIAVSLLLALELAIFEPQLGAIADAVALTQAPGTLPATMFATTAFFAIVVAGAIMATSRVALGLRVPTARGLRSHWIDVVRNEPSRDREHAEFTPRTLETVQPGPQFPARASSVRHAMMMLDRRDEQAQASPAGLAVSAPGAPSFISIGSEPLGQSSRRNATSSTRAGERRDQVQ